MIWLWKNMEFNFCIFFLIWYWFLLVSVALIWTGFASLLLYLIWPNIIGQVKWIWPLLNFGWLNELAQPVVWVGQINRLMVLSQSTGHKVDSPLLINQADLLQIYLVCVEWPVCYEFREHGANEAEQSTGGPNGDIGLYEESRHQAPAESRDEVDQTDPHCTLHLHHRHKYSDEMKICLLFFFSFAEQTRNSSWFSTKSYQFISIMDGRWIREFQVWLNGTHLMC